MMEKLTEKTLRRLIAHDEEKQVEFKQSAPWPSDLAERMCAMANAKGGRIIIGVEDGSLKIVGVPGNKLANTRDLILRAARLVQPAVSLDPEEPEIFDLDGKHLVVVTVLPSSGAVYQASGVVWVRRGSHTVRLSVPEMLELASDRGLRDWELEVVSDATLDDIDQKRVEGYLRQRSARSRRAQRFDDLAQVLVGLKCAAWREGRVVPTNAGLLFFGYDPQQHLVQSEVSCVLYKAVLGVGGYADRKTLTGTAQELIDGAEAFLNQHIPVAARIQGWKRIDMPAYPLESLLTL